MAKKIISLFATFVMVLCVTGIGGIETFALKYDAYDDPYGDSNTIYDYGDFGYRILEDGTAEIVYYYVYDSDETELVIPDTVDDIKVTSVGDHTFMEQNSIVSVEIPEGITNIGDAAFEMCHGIKSLTLPDSLVNIGELAFYDCGNLKSVTIPKSVTSVGEKAFGYYNNWKEGELQTPDFHIDCYMYTAGESYAYANGFSYTVLDLPSSGIYGDANGDGAINMLDVLLIRKYIAKQPVTLDLDAAEVTCDGSINMLDVLLIRKFIAKQPVVLGPQG